MIDFDTKLKNLEKNYKYFTKEIASIKKELKIEGITTESKANGLVKNPKVQILIDYNKQILSINSQILKIKELLDNLEDDEDDFNL